MTLSFHGSLEPCLGHPLSEHFTGAKLISGKTVLWIWIQYFGFDIPIFPFLPPCHSGPFQAGKGRGLGYGQGEGVICVGRPSDTISQLLTWDKFLTMSKTWFPFWLRQNSHVYEVKTIFQYYQFFPIYRVVQ